MGNMKRILILGATGMLGSAVYGVLKDKYELALAVRSKNKIGILDRAHGGLSKHKVVEFDAARLYQNFLDKKGYPGEYLKNFLSEVGRVDYAVNAIGVTIPFSLGNQALTFFVNSALPHVLAGELKEKLIHITTDCVYDGKEGFPYDENSRKTPVDLYGLSKSLGEPLNCLTLRTSIIGRELGGFTGLLEWFLKQEKKTVTGFANHFWNGVTTKEFGKICDRIISTPESFPKTGLYHVFSNPVSKYDMLRKFKDKYGIDCEIKKDEEQRLNRTLSTVHDLAAKLAIPPFDEMINDL